MLASNPGPRACHFVQVWVKVSVRVVKTVKLLWRMSIHSASPDAENKHGSCPFAYYWWMTILL
jgi:hypothetical protein